MMSLKGASLLTMIAAACGSAAAAAQEVCQDELALLQVHQSQMTTGKARVVKGSGITSKTIGNHSDIALASDSSVMLQMPGDINKSKESAMRDKQKQPTSDLLFEGHPQKGNRSVWVGRFRIRNRSEDFETNSSADEELVEVEEVEDGPEPDTELGEEERYFEKRGNYTDDDDEDEVLEMRGNDTVLVESHSQVGQPGRVIIISRRRFIHHHHRVIIVGRRRFIHHHPYIYHPVHPVYSSSSPFLRILEIIGALILICGIGCCILLFCGVVGGGGSYYSPRGDVVESVVVDGGGPPTVVIDGGYSPYSPRDAVIVNGGDRYGGDVIIDRDAGRYGGDVTIVDRDAGRYGDDVTIVDRDTGRSGSSGSTTVVYT